MKTPLALRFATAVLLGLVAVSTVIGLAVLWPDRAQVERAADRVAFLSEGTTLQRGEILAPPEACETDRPVGADAPLDAPVGAENPPAGTESGPVRQSGAEPEVQRACQQLSVGLRTGPDAGRMVEVRVYGPLALSGLRVGDRVELAALPSAQAGNTAPRYELANRYEASGVVRHVPLAILALIFVAVVVAVGRIRGLFALLALVIAAGVLLGFVLPALVAGGPGLLIGMVGSVAIMFVTLYFVHGPSMRTTSALIGTLAGILIISGISWVAVSVTRLSGLGDESSGMLATMMTELDFRGLLSCSILIAGLGVLNDVTITQASAVWELRAAAPEMTRRELYARGMRIGRDHIASTVYTVFFAYAGAAIGTLILLYLYDLPVLSLLTQEDIALELVRTMAGSIGLVLAVPITTWVAAMFVPPAQQQVQAWAAAGTSGPAGRRSAAE